MTIEIGDSYKLYRGFGAEHKRDYICPYLWGKVTSVDSEEVKIKVHAVSGQYNWLNRKISIFGIYKTDISDFMNCSEKISPDQLPKLKTDWFENLDWGMLLFLALVVILFFLAPTLQNL